MGKSSENSSPDQKNVAEWTVADVQSWLDSLGLGSLKQAFGHNAVNGRDLLDIVKEDLLVHLGVTFLQAKKIKMELQALTSANTAQMQRAFPGSGQMHMLPPKGASGHLPPLAVEPPEEVKSPFDTPSDVNLVTMAYPVGNSASGGFQAPVPPGKIEYTSHQENSRTNSAIRNENTAAATGDTGIECGPQKILFGFGFFLGVTWYVGAFLPACAPNKTRTEKRFWITNIVLSAMFTIAWIALVVVLANGGQSCYYPYCYG